MVSDARLSYVLCVLTDHRTVLRYDTLRSFWIFKEIIVWDFCLCSRVPFLVRSSKVFNVLLPSVVDTVGYG